MMIEMNERKKKEDKPIVKVKKGEIGYTDEYKYLGDQ